MKWAQLGNRQNIHKLLVNVHKMAEKQGKMLIEFIDKSAIFLAGNHDFCKNKNRWKSKSGSERWKEIT